MFVGSRKRANERGLIQNPFGRWPETRFRPFAETNVSGGTTRVCDDCARRYDPDFLSERHPSRCECGRLPVIQWLLDKLRKAARHQVAWSKIQLELEREVLVEE